MFRGFEKAFGRKGRIDVPPTPVETIANGKINSSEALIALAEKWSEKTELADNLRKLAQLLSVRETDEWITDDAKRVDELFATINSQGRNIGIHIKPEDF